MLYDRGLATADDIKKSKEYLSNPDRRGCVGERICEGCSHIIADSICLCIGIFTCPNCGFENGKDFKKAIESASTIEYKPLYQTGIIWPTLEGRLNQPITTELEALEQLEKCVPLSEEGKKRLEKLLKD